MKTIKFACFLFILCGPVSGQADQDIHRQYDELRNRVKVLEKENQAIKLAQRSADSIVYCSIRYEIFDAFSDISQLDFDFKRTLDQIAVTGLFTRLMQANNPTSDILGFKFSDLIFSAAQKHFIGELTNEPDKKRFSQVISKIISNPVISSVAHSNPISSVVSSIISTIVGFTTATVSLDKEGGRIRDVTVEQRDPFDQKSISEFRNELQVYIAFYDELIEESDKYLAGLENLNVKYAHLVQSVRSYKEELFSMSAVKDNNQLISLTLSLPEPTRPEIDYNRLMHDPGIRHTLMTARKNALLKQSVSDFKKEYNTLLFAFLNNYRQTLETAKKFPDPVIDKTRTDQLINDIESFISNQKRSEQAEPDVFN